MVADRDEQVVLLNQDLMGEHQAIVHYLTHAWTVVQSFSGAIEAIARDEMRHFKWLAHAIVVLGGVPDLTPPDLLPQLDGLQALDYDIDAEEEAISQYLLHQGAIADARVQALLARIVVDERAHRREFLHMRDEWLSRNDPDIETTEVSQKVALPFQQLIAKEYQSILRYLMQSFLNRHGREVGLDFEDRAVDEMKHMAWLAETMADLGGMPRFSLSNPQDDGGALYTLLKQWAEQAMPGLVPIIDRIIAHERYQADWRGNPAWTVGSMADGGGSTQWMS